MALLKKSLVTALSMLFIFSVAFQMCCHEDIFELWAHQHQTEAAAHSHSGDHSKSPSSDTDCSIHQLKNLFKPDKILASTSQWVSSFDISFESEIIFHFPGVLKRYSFRRVFFNKAGPPIYLLNSVFLN